MLEGKTILKTEVTRVNKFTQQMKIHFTDGTKLVVTPSPSSGLYFDTIEEDGRVSGIHPENMNG